MSAVVLSRHSLPVLADDPGGDWPNAGEVRRMARHARERGVTLTIKPTGAVVVDPRDAAPHHLTGFSCDCSLFAAAGGCQHFSLFVDEMNWTPEAVAQS